MKRIILGVIIAISLCGASNATVQKLTTGESIYIATVTSGVTVTTNRTGIATRYPQYTLDVNGTANAKAYLLSSSITETIWIDPVYLGRTNAPSTNVLSTSLMETLDFNTTGNIRFQHECPEWDDAVSTVNLVIEYTVATTCTSSQTIAYGVSYNIVAVDASFNGALTSLTGSVSPSMNAGIKKRLVIPLAAAGGTKSVQVHFNRYGGTVGAMQVLNVGLAYHRSRL